IERIDAPAPAFFVGMNDEIEAEIARGGVAEFDHLAKLPSGIDVQQRKRRLRRIKGLHRQAQQHRRILADRIEEDRRPALGNRLAQDVNGLLLQPLEMMRLAHSKPQAWVDCATTTE